jgi:hypothetical protein
MDTGTHVIFADTHVGYYVYALVLFVQYCITVLVVLCVCVWVGHTHTKFRSTGQSALSHH